MEETKDKLELCLSLTASTFNAAGDSLNKLNKHLHLAWDLQELR